MKDDVRIVEVFPLSLAMLIPVFRGAIETLPETHPAYDEMNSTLESVIDLVGTLESLVVSDFAPFVVDTLHDEVASLERRITVLFNESYDCLNSEQTPVGDFSGWAAIINVALHLRSSAHLTSEALYSLKSNRDPDHDLKGLTPETGDVD